MDIKQKVLQSISRDINICQEKIHLEAPENEQFGDYSTNVALTFKGGSLKGGPKEYAAEIVKKLQKDKELLKVVEKIEVAGPGFINFWLKKEVLIDTLVDISIYKDTFGKGESLNGKKIVVEFTDPNPFKEFHVGHLYSNTVGESISRLFESQGAKVWRADYFGDVGMHVAKAIWGLLEKFEEEKISLEDLEKKELTERVEYLGQAYARGASAYEEDESAKEEMKSLNFLIFKAAQEIVLSDFKEKAQVNYDQFIKESKFDFERIKEIYKRGRAWSLEYFENIYKRLGMGFDGYYPESRTGEYGYGMVLEGLSKGIFEKGDGGAIIFPGEKYGLHNRVFINAMNLPTYEAKDFGNSVAKYKDFEYDTSFIVTGNEINEYFLVVLKALGMYRKELADATTHIGHGMVRLPEGKMSSRTGKIIKGEWVLDEAKKKVLNIVEKSESFSKSNKEDKDKLAESVAQAAVKYAFLKQGIGNNIAFDFETSLSFEGNSGPYLQYTFARTQSVLRNSKLKTKDLRLKTESIKYSVLSVMLNDEEAMLLRSFVRFVDVIIDAAKNYSPNILCNYLYDLAQKFNLFYQKHRIIDAEDERVEEQESKSISNFRLALTAATGQIIKNGLKLLGIESPERM